MAHAYRVVILRRAVKELKAVGHLKDRSALAARIAGLADDPRPAGCAKLEGMEAYRVRQGDYRILYTVNDREVVVEVIRVGHRSDVYR